MAREEVQRFLAALESDAALKAKVDRGVAESSNRVAALAAVARAEGYQVGDEELIAVAQDARELGDDELEKVAGGVGSIAPLRLEKLLSGPMISPHDLGMMKDA